MRRLQRTSEARRLAVGTSAPFTLIFTITAAPSAGNGPAPSYVRTVAYHNPPSQPCRRSGKKPYNHEALRTFVFGGNLIATAGGDKVHVPLGAAILFDIYQSIPDAASLRDALREKYAAYSGRIESLQLGLVPEQFVSSDFRFAVEELRRRQDVLVFGYPASSPRVAIRQRGCGMPLPGACSERALSPDDSALSRFGADPIPPGGLRAPPEHPWRKPWRRTRPRDFNRSRHFDGR